MVNFTERKDGLPALIINRELGTLEGVPVFSTEISDKKALLELKPKTFSGNDSSWLASCATTGLMHSYNHDFQDFHSQRVQIGDPAATYTPNCLPSFLKAHFGEFGERIGTELSALNLDSKKEWESLTEALCKQIQSATIESLGTFGQWLKESAVPERFKAEIVREFMED